MVLALTNWMALSWGSASKKYETVPRDGASSTVTVARFSNLSASVPSWFSRIPSNGVPSSLAMENTMA